MQQRPQGVTDTLDAPAPRKRKRQQVDAPNNATTPQVLRGSGSAPQRQDGPPPPSDAHRPQQPSVSRPTDPRTGTTARLGPRRSLQRLVQQVARAVSALLALSTQTKSNEVLGELLHDYALNYEPQAPLHPLHAFKATSDPDTMYHHQAMRQPDSAEFCKAMMKEVNNQMANGNFEVIP